MMVNGTSLASGSVAQSEASGGGRTVRVETCVNSKLAEVRRFQKVTEGGWYGGPWFMNPRRGGGNFPLASI